MKQKSHHRNRKHPGLAAKLVNSQPRAYTGDPNDKKALARYQRGEVVFANGEFESPRLIKDTINDVLETAKKNRRIRLGLPDDEKPAEDGKI